jgi:hypothetical protein
MDETTKEYFDFIKKLETDPGFCLEYIKQNPEHEQCLKTLSQSAKHSYQYSFNLICKNIPSDLGKPDLTQNYRFKLGEPAILKNSQYTCLYAKNVISGRWIEAEELIGKCEANAIWYAENVVKGEFKLGEETIAKDADQSLRYAKLIWKRFELGEPSIATNADCSFDYANNILKGRFELGEPAIATNKELMLKYALEIVKGKLPEDMHNKMIGAALAA